MRILYADDSRTLRLATADLLRSMGHEVVEAEEGLQAIERYVTQPPDLVILDVDMPMMNGYEAARELRRIAGDHGWIPIMFLSGNVSDADVARGIDSGGDDYLMKPVSAVVLRAKINAMQRITDMRRKLVDLSKELETTNAALQVHATQDGLTGIPNRRAFDAALEREWNHAVRDQSPIALILGDVDHFKKFNDNYGHLQGDECLRTVAQTLVKSAHRKIDLAARYGGEEFALLLPSTPAVSALLVAGRVLEAVRALRIPHSGSTTSAHITISLGVTSGAPGKNQKLEDLIRIADRALYEAKSKGRNQAVILPFPA